MESPSTNIPSDLATRAAQSSPLSDKIKHSCLKFVDKSTKVPCVASMSAG